jgi:putative oxidoreductase
MSLALALLYLGRFLLGAAFVAFGLRNLSAIPRLTEAMEKKGLPQAKTLMTIGVGIQIVGGVMVALGLFAALGALALAVFVIVAAYLFHPFWEHQDAARTPHLTAWIMNVGLCGAFLMVVAISL